MVILFTHMPIYCVLVCCPQRPAKGIELPGPALIGGSEAPMWVLGINLSPLEEQPVVLVARPCLCPTLTFIQHLFRKTLQKLAIKCFFFSFLR